MIYLTFVTGTADVPIATQDPELIVGPFIAVALMSTALLAGAHPGQETDIIAHLENEGEWRLVTHDWPTLRNYDEWRFSDVLVRPSTSTPDGAIDPRHDLDLPIPNQKEK